MQMSQTIGFSIADTKKLTGLFLPLGILTLVGMLVLPLPVVLLDVFFVFSRMGLRMRFKEAPDWLSNFIFSNGTTSSTN